MIIADGLSATGGEKNMTANEIKVRWESICFSNLFEDWLIFGINLCGQGSNMVSQQENHAPFKTFINEKGKKKSIWRTERLMSLLGLIEIRYE